MLDAQSGVKEPSKPSGECLHDPASAADHGRGQLPTARLAHRPRDARDHGAARAPARALAGACGAAPAYGQTATTGTPQSLFTHEIAVDKGTAPDIRSGLRDHRVFVD